MICSMLKNVKLQYLKGQSLQFCWTNVQSNFKDTSKDHSWLDVGEVRNVKNSTPIDGKWKFRNSQDDTKFM